ncbi:MAG: hypothetical protein EAX95_13575 [Candidatus Thorarchaeota archaeon]|nr:hypothetical protein [Candidatus Thorarchaeota archaeon]
MKQYWRVGTIRVLLSLAMSMFVLGRYYYIYIPVISDWGLLGALVLGSVLVLFFMFVGWLYDEKAKMWSQQMQASAERNPYFYLSDFRGYAIDYPFLYATLESMRNTLEKVGEDTSSIDDSLRYFGGYFSRVPEREDIIDANKAGQLFMKQHPFAEGEMEDTRDVPRGSKLKLHAEVQMLRLTWVQSLTAIIQDALILGIFMTTLLITGGTVSEATIPVESLLLGLLAISLPLFLAIGLLGWVYDKKLKVWSADSIVKVQRNPYNYVPSPKANIYVIPFMIALFYSMKEILKRLELNTDVANEIIDFLEEYDKLTASRDEDMAEARALRDRYGPVFQQSSLE